jgi:cell division protein FtsI (penicillin-binding protein 3)
MRLIDRRLGLLFAVFLLLFSVALARAAWLQGIRGGELRASAHDQQTESVEIPGERGRIIDRNGNVMAVSEDAYSVIATPYQVQDPSGTATRLAEHLDTPSTELEDLLGDRESGFAYLERKVDLASAEAIQNLEIEGISLLPDSRRVYPQGELAAQVIGAVGLDNEGLTGLEQAADETLHGEDGEREIVNDATGDPIRFEEVRSESTGEDLAVTLDSAIQARAEEALAASAVEWGAKGATAVVMNPKTSEVLAIANWPTLDPTGLDEADEEQLTNRATGFTYEPGSTFKAFTVAAALEEKLVTPSTPFDLPPTIKVADRKIEESHPRPHLTLTVEDILAQSSNVGAVKVGLEVGSERFDRWIREFGFGEPTGVGFGAEERGIVPALEDYSGSTMGNLPIGQGLSVTPLQMVAGYAAIANGGILRSPRLVARVGDEQVGTEEGRRVISERTAEQVRRMMEGVLEPGGTAPQVSVPGYVLAGKTGTAEKAEDGTYSETRYVASFVGFAPSHDPSLLVGVVVDEPTGSYYGGEVAAPVFAEIASFALPYLGISPD